MDKGKETDLPCQRIPNSLSRPRWLNYFYLTINKMLCTLHYVTYINQTGLSNKVHLITWEQSSTKYVAGLWSYTERVKDPSKPFLSAKAGNRNEGKVRRKGT